MYFELQKYNVLYERLDLEKTMPYAGLVPDRTFRNS